MPTRSQEHLIRVGRATSSGYFPSTNDPKITQLTPNTGVHGGGSVVVQVLGSGFSSNCFVEVNHAPVPTTRMSSTELKGTVDLNTWSTPQQLEFTVRDAISNQESNSVMFNLT